MLVEFPRCDVDASPDAVRRLESAFGAYWEKGISLGEAMIELRAPSPGDSWLRNIDGIYDARLRGCSAIAIEGGYFDLRQPNAEDRLQHLDHALQLYMHMRRHHRVDRERLLLQAFLNDFTDEPVCTASACDIELGTDAGSRKASSIVRNALIRKYRLFDLDPPHIFGMRETSDRIRRFMHGVLRRGADNVSVAGENVYIDTLDGRVLLGYLRGSRFVPRCTSLIAQHYYDVYILASSKSESIQCLWLFDFNRWTERESVRQGAAAAFELFEWPKTLALNVVNYLYSSGTALPGDYELLSWPP